MQLKTTISTIVLSTVLVLPCASFAKGGGGGHHGGALNSDHYGKSSVLTAIYDTNGDGTVTSDEVTAVRTADYNAADVDKSASLSLAELQNLQASVKTREIAAHFASLDTDTSSTLSLAELTGTHTNTTAISTAFALADSDSNSALSLTEFTTLQNRGTGSGIWEFARLDTDGSQTITLTEYLATPSHH